jgi:hypothetical protein
VVLGFELDWGQIAERRVKALVIVDPLQELGDGGARIRQIAVLVAVDLFVFERLHEGLAGGVVPRISLARHADFDALGFEQIRVVVLAYWEPRSE